VHVMVMYTRTRFDCMQCLSERIIYFSHLCVYDLSPRLFIRKDARTQDTRGLYDLMATIYVMIELDDSVKTKSIRFDSIRFDSALL